MDQEVSEQQEFDRLEGILQDPCSTPVTLTLDFLRSITNDFSEELGRGTFGVVYKGVLQNGKPIAVKRLHIVATDLDDVQYQKELSNLSGLGHENIVQFKGYCAHSSQVPWPLESQSQGSGTCILAEKRERLLCFEYVPNKSLRDHISDASCGLEWLARYDIIKGICSGLHYLHTERDIVHMDLKPENILLDDNMVPKITDFGTSRLFDPNESHIMTKHSVGTLGYIAPEYLTGGIISKAADIFSFGVITLELLTGSKSNYPGSLHDKYFDRFTEDVVEKWTNRLPNADHSRQIRTCIRMAVLCVANNRKGRPSTGRILEMLNVAQLQDKLDEPGMESPPRRQGGCCSRLVDVLGVLGCCRKPRTASRCGGFKKTQAGTPGRNGPHGTNNRKA